MTDYSWLNDPQLVRLREKCDAARAKCARLDIRTDEYAAAYAALCEAEDECAALSNYLHREAILASFEEGEQ